MTPTRTRSTLRAATVVLWTASLAAVAAAVLLPYTLPAADPAASSVPPVRTAATTRALAADAFDGLLDIDLHRPLTDPAAQTATADATTRPIGPDVRLAGIVAEPGHSYALLVTPGGTTTVTPVGGRAGVAEVVAIGPAAVTLKYPGGQATLTLPAPRVAP